MNNINYSLYWEFEVYFCTYYGETKESDYCSRSCCHETQEVRHFPRKMNCTVAYSSIFQHILRRGEVLQLLPTGMLSVNRRFSCKRMLNRMFIS